MKEKLKLVLTIAPIILVADQFTKWWVNVNIPYGGEKIIFEHFFSLVHYRNKGAAFGVLAGWDSAYRDLFFYVLATVALFFLLSFLRQLPDNKKNTVIPVGLILGGALGNIADRIFRGSVIDFFSFHWDNKHVIWALGEKTLEFDLVWPAFNIADSAISVGVVCLMWMMLKHPEKEDQK